MFYSFVCFCLFVFIPFSHSCQFEFIHLTKYERIFIVIVVKFTASNCFFTFILHFSHFISVQFWIFFFSRFLFFCFILFCLRTHRTHMILYPIHQYNVVMLYFPLCLISRVHNVHFYSFLVFFSRFSHSLSTHFFLAHFYFVYSHFFIYNYISLLPFVVLTHVNKKKSKFFAFIFHFYSNHFIEA